MAGLRLAYHCMLRTMEMLSLTRGQISVDEQRGVVALPLTKIGRRKGAQELVTVNDQWLLRKLGAEKAKHQPHEKLLRCSNTGFRTWFEKALNFLGVSHLGLRPYSIRRHGATHDFRCFGSTTR